MEYHSILSDNGITYCNDNGVIPIWVSSKNMDELIKDFSLVNRKFYPEISFFSTISFRHIFRWKYSASFAHVKYSLFSTVFIVKIRILRRILLPFNIKFSENALNGSWVNAVAQTNGLAERIE